MNPSELQHDYYTSTAAVYDSTHASDEVFTRLWFAHLSMILESLKPKSLLDVGCGSGRALTYLQEHHPNIRAWGVEPVDALREQAIAKGIPRESLFEGNGYALPFEDQSFDVACEFAILHHVEDPARIVNEMCRVARRAVFIADANRFSSGSMLSRWLKLGIYRAHLWPAFEFIRTKGKMHHFSEGDGLFYSFSVYDCLDQLTAWSDQLLLLSADPEPARSWLHPLLTSRHMVACAIREAASVE